jgi:chromosome segregation ATPase
MNTFKTSLCLEELGDRWLPSGFGGFGHWSGFGHFGGNLSPAVKADLAQLHTDEQKLQTDLATLAPTLQTDRQALQTAIQTAYQNNTDVQSAQATLTADRTKWKAALKGDWQAILSATDSAMRATAFAQLRTDVAAAAKAIGADVTALHAAIQADPGVQTDTATLQKDLTPITDDKAAIQADLVQLKADLHAGNSGG